MGASESQGICNKKQQSVSSRWCVFGWVQNISISLFRTFLFLSCKICQNQMYSEWLFPDWYDILGFNDLKIHHHDMVASLSVRDEWCTVEARAFLVQYSRRCLQSMKFRQERPLQNFDHTCFFSPEPILTLCCRFSSLTVILDFRLRITRPIHRPPSISSHAASSLHLAVLSIAYTMACSQSTCR